MNNNIENRLQNVQQQIMGLAVDGDKRGDYLKCSSFTGEE